MRNQLAGFDYQPAPRRQAHLIITGVSISVNCDLLIHRSQRNAEQIGGLLFRLTKSDEDESEYVASRRREMGLYAATLVRLHIAANLAGNRAPTSALCWSVDVQNGEKQVCPNAHTQRVQNLEGACRFIAALWQTA